VDGLPPFGTKLRSLYHVSMKIESVDHPVLRNWIVDTGRLYWQGAPLRSRSSILPPLFPAAELPELWAIPIKIYEAVESGYMFDIWLNEEADEDEVECDDGVLCTGSYEDAVQMAYTQAVDLLKKQKKHARELT